MGTRIPMDDDLADRAFEIDHQDDPSVFVLGKFTIIKSSGSVVDPVAPLKESLSFLSPDSCAQRACKVQLLATTNVYAK